MKLYQQYQLRKNKNTLRMILLTVKKTYLNIHIEFFSAFISSKKVKM